MNSLLKQRIIGAVVLVSLGIIFIPILLTGKGDFMSDELKSNIPPMPMYEIEAPAVLALPSETPSEALSEISGEPGAEPQDRPVEQVAQAEPEPPVEAIIKKKQDKPDDKDSRPALTAIAPVPEKTIPTKQNLKPTPKIVETEVSVAAPPKPQPPIVSTPTVATAVKEPIVSGWVVQIGSFTVEKNALKLRDKLRKKGHASFVESFNKNNGMIYRVRVGPELTKGLAENLSKQLNQETQLNGLVMRYPN